MNYFEEIAPQSLVQGTQTVAGAVTGAGTVDWTTQFEPNVGVALVMGSAIAALTSCTGYVHTSNDGATWSTLGSLVSSAGTLANGQVVYGTLGVTQRYMRGRLEFAGAGGTATASLVALAKARTVTT
jgi:hypothetical protein